MEMGPTPRPSSTARSLAWSAGMEIAPSFGRTQHVNTGTPPLSPWATAAVAAIGLLFCMFPVASALPRDLQQAFWRTGFYRVGGVLSASAVLLGLAAVFVKPRSGMSIAVGISTAILGSGWLAVALWVGQMMRGYFHG